MVSVWSLYGVAALMPADIKNTAESTPVFNIHNIQNQQGPTEINVQDSVVTDWNQR